MATTDSMVTIHMVASLDGFIARKDGDVAWLETSDRYEEGVAGENAEEFMKTIDCFVIGARTYELALKLGWPYGDVPTFVLSHRPLASDRSSVAFHSGDLEDFVNDRLKPRYRNIWVVGGAAVVGDFFRLKLADEVRITIAPIIIGDGIPFFDGAGERALHLRDVTAYRTGFVELWYDVVKG